MLTIYDGGVRRMISLNIETINSNLTIEQRPSKINVEGINADFAIEKRDAKFDMYIRNAEIEIHNYPAYQQLNYKNIGDFSDQYAAISRQNGAEAIGEISSNGDEMMQIESKGNNPIVSIAERNANRFSGDTVNIQFYPENNIDISVREGGISTNFEPGSVSTNVYKRLNISADKGETIITADRYARVNVTPVGSVVDYKI